jgi:hypothetical protein
MQHIQPPPPPHNTPKSSPSRSQQQTQVAVPRGEKRPLDPEAEDAEPNPTLAKKKRVKKDKKKDGKKTNNIPEPTFEECHNLWDHCTSLKTSPPKLVRLFAFLTVLLRARFVSFNSFNCSLRSLTPVDRPLPACTDPYLLALFSDGPRRSSEKNNNKSSKNNHEIPTHPSYDSYKSLEWIGDSFLEHYIRTHFCRILGKAHAPQSHTLILNVRSAIRRVSLTIRFRKPPPHTHVNPPRKM